MFEVFARTALNVWFTQTYGTLLVYVINNLRLFISYELLCRLRASPVTLRPYPGFAGD